MVVWGASAERQFDRIINRDFPWLWAVRPSWLPAQSEIRIKHADADRNPRAWNELDDLLSGFSDKEGREVWIKTRMSVFTEVTIIRPAPNRSVSHRIIATLNEGSDVEYIAVCQSVGLDQGRLAITIYKPPRRDRNFNSLIANAAKAVVSGVAC